MSASVDNLEYEKMSPEQIDNLRVEKEKELKDAEHSASLVKDESLDISKKILELRIQKNDIDAAYERARFNVKRIQSDIKILTSKFWQAKGR